MTKTILLVILIAFSYINSAAQIDSVSAHKNSFNIKIGYNKTYFKDLNFSPLQYQSNSYAIGLDYERLLNNNRLTFLNIGLSSALLKTQASNYFNSNRYLVNLKIGYLGYIALSDKKTSFQVGGQYHTYLNMIFYEGVDAFTYYGLHGFDIIGKINYHLKEKHKISTSIELPVFGLLVRPPYSGINKFQQENKKVKTLTSGEWSTMNHFFALQWAIDYQYQLSNKMELTITNKFSIHQTKTLHSTKIIDNQILIGTNFKF